MKQGNSSCGNSVIKSCTELRDGSFFPRTILLSPECAILDKQIICTIADFFSYMS